MEELKEKGVLTTIRWVPGHFGIEGNEKADLLAKKAASKAFLTLLRLLRGRFPG